MTVELRRTRDNKKKTTPRGAEAKRIMKKHPNFWMRWTMFKKLIHRNKIKCTCGFVKGNYYDVRLHSTDCDLLHAWRMAAEIIKITVRLFSRETTKCTCGWRNGDHAADCETEQVWQLCEGEAIDAVMEVRASSRANIA